MRLRVPMHDQHYQARQGQRQKMILLGGGRRGGRELTYLNTMGISTINK